MIEEQTGKAVAGLGGEVSCHGDQDPWKQVRTFQTDSVGIAVLTGLPHGPCEIRLHNGASAEGNIRRAETTKVLVAVPGTVAICGQVEDNAGCVVPYAEIWLTGQGNSMLRMRVATADGIGRFRFDHIPCARSLAAIDKNHVRTGLVDISAPAGDSQSVVLKFPAGTPGELHGSILMSEVELRAMVTLTPMEIPRTRSIGTASIYTNSPRQIQAEREFEFYGLVPGEYELSVSATGFETCSRQVSIDPGESKYCPIVLTRGNTICGITRDARTGELLEGVHIACSSNEHGGCYSSFSDEKGIFRIVGVPNGRAQLFAQHESAGQARMPVNVESGDMHSVELLISRGLELSGSVICADRRKLQFLKVALARESPAMRGYELIVPVNSDGTFCFWNCEDRKYTIDLLPTQGFGVISSKTSVSPHESPVALTAELDRLPSAWLVGTIGSDAQIPFAGSLLMVGDKNQKEAYRIDSRVGSFRVGPFVPGEYEVDAACQGFGTALVDTVELNESDIFDLGKITLQPPVNLVLSFSGIDSGKLASLSCELRDARGRPVISLRRILESVDIGLLPCGSYTLEFSRGNHQVLHVPLTLSLNTESSYHIDLTGRIP